MTIHETDQLAAYAIVAAMALLGISATLQQFRVRYNLFNIPKDIKEFFLGFLLGKRLLFKIEGTWQLGRGWRDRKAGVFHA